MSTGSLTLCALAKSDSFGLLPSPLTRVLGVPPRLFDSYTVPVDPADETNCEACQ